MNMGFAGGGSINPPPANAPGSPQPYVQQSGGRNEPVIDNHKMIITDDDEVFEFIKIWTKWL